MCLPHTLWPLFPLNVPHTGVCSVEKCVGGVGALLEPRLPRVFAAPQFTWGRDVRHGQSVVVQRQDPQENTEAAWTDSIAGVMCRYEKCSSHPVMPGNAYRLSRLQAVLNMRFVLVPSIILPVTKHQEKCVQTVIRKMVNFFQRIMYTFINNTLQASKNSNNFLSNSYESNLRFLQSNLECLAIVMVISSSFH